MISKTSYRMARMRTGMTQKEAAEAAGLEPAVLNRIESGVTKPRHDTLLKLADAYRCTLDDLCGRGKPGASP